MYWLRKLDRPAVDRASSRAGSQDRTVLQESTDAGLILRLLPSSVEMAPRQPQVHVLIAQQLRSKESLTFSRVGAKVPELTLFKNAWKNRQLWDSLD